MIGAQLVLMVAMTAATPDPSSSSMSSPPPGQHFDDAMAQGAAAFDAFDLAAAESGFSRAAAFAPSPKARALAVLWLGAVRAENGDFPSAKQRFADAVIFDVDVVVPAGMSPTIVALVDDARRALRESRGLSPVLTTSGDPVIERPRWALLSGAAVTTLGVLAVGGGAMVGMQAITQRDVASSLAFQNEAVAGYAKAQEGALWSNVLYGAGGVLVATGSGLAIASIMGADSP
jgi:hypothetical protein